MNLKAIFQSPLTKILAISLAIVYWVLVTAPRREKIFERTFEVPLVLLGVPEHLIINSPVRDTIRVRLRGPATVLRGLSSQTLEAAIDLSIAQEGGDVTAPISTASLNIPPEVTVVGIDPRRVTVRVEPRRQKVVPIRHFLVGDLPTGYQLGEVILVPPTALVSGPASVITDVLEVATERVFLSDRVASFQRNVALSSDDPRVSIVNPRSARLSIEILPPAPPPEVPAVDTAITSTSPP